MKIRSTKDNGELLEIERIYTVSFPDNERAPLKLLKKRAEQGKADFLALYEDNKIIGMSYIVCRGDLAYLFYIAIDPTERGRGYGTAALKELMSRYRGKRFFLALEQLDKAAENYAQRVQRHSFYSSCGLYDLPFLLKEGEVTFAAMGKKLSADGSDDGKFTVTAKEYGALTKSYLGFPMKFLVEMRLIPLPENNSSTSL